MPVFFAPSVVEGRVYRKKKKNGGDDEKQALEELQAILNTKNRKSCDCEAQLHDLLENCLNCGRLTCVAEGPGKCFSCGSIMLSHDQRERLRKHIDIVQSFPTSSSSSQPLSGSKIKVVDNQFDHSSIANRKHLREEERRALRETLEELQASKYQKKLVLNVDLDNMEAGSSSVPKIDDYEAEMRNLKISQPLPGSSSSNPTLMEVLQVQPTPKAHVVISNSVQKGQSQNSKSSKENQLSTGGNQTKKIESRSKGAASTQGNANKSAGSNRPDKTKVPKSKSARSQPSAWKTNKN